MEIKFGYYAIIDDSLLKMYHSNKGWELISNKLDFVKYGFTQKDNYCFKIIDKNINISAFRVQTYCTYKGFKFFIESFSNEIYYTRPLEDAMKHFKDYTRQGYDPMYEFTENEMSDIWEERKPIEGFKFDVEPIVYLKRKGE